MSDRGEGRSDTVVKLAVVRRRKARLQAAAEREKKGSIATSLHVDITTDGNVMFPPLLVHSAQALALLKIVLAVSTHLLEVHAGRAY
jgi:hypothetical protein